MRQRGKRPVSRNHPTSKHKKNKEHMTSRQEHQTTEPGRSEQGTPEIIREQGHQSSREQVAEEAKDERTREHWTRNNRLTNPKQPTDTR
jgi:hypothetical protein